MDRDGRLSGVVGDRVDVAALPAPADARLHPDRLGVRADAQAALVQLALGADEPDRRLVVVVEAGSLTRHPRQHPDVDPVVLVQQLVAPSLPIDHDKGLPQVWSGGDLLHQADELALGQEARSVEEIRGSRCELVGKRGDGDGFE